ncbi:hypothetical protein [Paenibacillus eucommiae]|uniref:Uncharacterized protein n=1 Tax=Paenibacillus eucommiae TaxID=1355755 RepID=A0ABS4INU7_9BACL|nr:hypothetical protein [Paenibacillus eucommiae]MBP1989228.1 hypothetical protein [Paenibacillus eucommiae]
MIAITWWAGGIVAGILFYAFAMMLELLLDISQDLKAVRKNFPNTNMPPKLGNSKMKLDSLKGYKMNAKD